MKTSFIYFLLLFLGLKTTSFAQQAEYWGLTKMGGYSNRGCIYKTDTDGNNQTIVHSFRLEADGQNPKGLCQASNGKLYGMTFEGGTLGIYGFGVLFEYDPITAIYTKKMDFDLSNGISPRGKLIEYNGSLYGLTQYGGANSKGVLFKYHINTGVYTVLVNFNSSGFSPEGSLILASNGKMYGTTLGGNNYDGLIFEFDPNSNIYTVKAHFNGINGSYPKGDLMEASNGNFYGMTRLGGNNNEGVLFEYNLSNNIISKLMDFEASISGNRPKGALIQASNGILYGTTQEGGPNNRGVLFSYDLGMNSYTVLFAFDGNINGGGPSYYLSEASNNHLYGMTSFGGTSLYGTIFEFNTSTNTLTKKVDFNGTENGGDGESNFIEASNGKLYAVTTGGGLGHSGTLIEYDISLDSLSKKLNFNYAPEGQIPEGKLVLASNGQLYGTTEGGGSKNNGCFFEFDPVLNSYSMKHEFDDPLNGYNPIGDLVEANNGNLYGLTRYGGQNGDGTIFEYNINSSNLIKVQDLSSITGIAPRAGMSKASNGKLYGVTPDGGFWNKGVLFEFEPGNNILSKKIDFEDSLGAYPAGLLIEASNGKLYGTCIIQGLFEYDISLETCIKKYTFGTVFNATYSPNGGLVESFNGKLYGTTTRGGINDKGILYEFDIATEILTHKMDFGTSSALGEYPDLSLLQGSNNKLYGTVSEGGTNGFGTLFEYDPQTNSYTQKLNFNLLQSGARPSGQLIEVDLSNIAVEKTASISTINIYPNPVNHKLFIDFDLSAIHSIEILDVQGLLAKSVPAQNNIYIADLANGVYLLRLVGKNKIYSQKFVKK